MEKELLNTFDKELLLKDICARLPYGVIALTEKGKGYICSVNLTIFGAEIGINVNPTVRDTFSIDDIKPYLFPLSSITEEQRKEFLSVAGYERRVEDCGRHTETYYYDMVGHECEFYPNFILTQMLLIIVIKII